MTAPDRPAWADEPTQEHTFPQRLRDEHELPAYVPTEIPAWLAQPTGLYRTILATLRE